MRRDQASETETRDRTPARRQVPAPGARTRLRGGLGGPVMVSIVVLALVAWGRPAPAADCGDWNTRRFFETAALRLVRECLAAGADLKVRAKYGSTPLHYAAGLTATPAVIVALITAGADLKARDKYGRTPLHRAAGSNRTSSVIVALLDAGADPKARTADGRTPWDVAQGNAALKDTAAWWRLNEGRF